MSDYTPGPWEFFDAKDEYLVPTISIRGNAEFIATMDTCAVDGGPFHLPPRAAANARLIAAAPELLEALKSFLRAPSIGSDGPGSSTIVIQEYNRRAALAAVAKAEVTE